MSAQKYLEDQFESLATAQIKEEFKLLEAANRDNEPTQNNDNEAPVAILRSTGPSAVEDVEPETTLIKSNLAQTKAGDGDDADLSEDEQMDGKGQQEERVEEPVESVHEPLNQAEREVLENERRTLLLGVIQRSMEGLTRQKKKEIALHKEDLTANEFDTVPAEDLVDQQDDLTDSQKEERKAELQKNREEAKKKRMEIVVPK